VIRTSGSYNQEDDNQFTNIDGRAEGLKTQEKKFHPDVIRQLNELKRNNLSEDIKNIQKIIFNQFDKP
jgi:hypothetical protein